MLSSAFLSGSPPAPIPIVAKAATVAPVIVTEVRPAAPPEPVRRVVQAYDFETPPPAELFSNSIVPRPGAAEEGNRYCLKGDFSKEYDVQAVSWHNWQKPLFAFTENEELEFDYYLTKAAPWANCSLTDAPNYGLLLESHSPGKWLHARLRLSDFSRTQVGGEIPPTSGTSVHCVVIQCPAIPGAEIYVDNLKLTSKDADPRGSAGNSAPR